MPIDDSKERLRKLLAKGTLFEGKYRIEGSLGEGAFAYVLKAHHEAMGRDIALKVLKPKLVESRPDVLERFLSEVRIVARLRSPNTVTVFDFGQSDEGLSYLVMEYVDGELLEDALAEGGGSIEPARAIRITEQILRSLDEAHSQGIVHRDLKPSNIMLTNSHGEEDVVKVLDFGVAKIVDKESQPGSSESSGRSTQFIGTPIYMSPEQALGEKVRPATDIYSLGLILYEMLTGKAPVVATNIAAVVRVHIADEPLPLEALPTLAPEFRKLIRKATAKDPTQRFEDARSFAQALRRVEELTSAAPAPGVEVETEPSVSSESLADEWDDFDVDEFLGEPTPEQREEPRRETKPSPRPKTRSHSRGSPVRPAGRKELKLDVERVRRAERRSEAVPPTVNHAAADRNRAVAWCVGGFVALLVSFMLASTLFASGDGVARWLVGLLPAVAAYLGAQFSSIRRTHGLILHRWFVPGSRNLLITTGALIVFVGLVMPGSAANLLSEDAAWFAAEGGVAHSLFSALGDIFSSLFSFAYRALPW